MNLTNLLAFSIMAFSAVACNNSPSASSETEATKTKAQALTKISSESQIALQDRVYCRAETLDVCLRDSTALSAEKRSRGEATQSFRSIGQACINRHCGETKNPLVMQGWTCSAPRILDCADSQGGGGCAAIACPGYTDITAQKNKQKQDEENKIVKKNQESNKKNSDAITRLFGKSSATCNSSALQACLKRKMDEPRAFGGSNVTETQLVECVRLGCQDIPSGQREVGCNLGKLYECTTEKAGGAACGAVDSSKNRPCFSL